MADNTRILLVEDDPNLGNVLSEFLEMRGFDVKLCGDGEEGLLSARREEFDICILDVMMPKKDGFEVAKQMRDDNIKIPIIFVTAKDKIDDKQKGFQYGDDYLTKPFSMEELVLRIKAVMRRYDGNIDKQALPGADIFTLGKFTFDYQLRQLKEEGEETKKLSTKEAELLRLLCQHSNQVLHRDLALTKIWGDDNYYTARSMDVFITKLRKYLKTDERLEIMNVHGTGYKLIIPASAAVAS